MILVDSSGWLEFFINGPLAELYAGYLQYSETLIVPSLAVYEVYKKIKKECGEEQALIAIGQMGKSKIVPLDDALAVSAADISLLHRLAMADAIIYATALQEQAQLITSDAHFEHLDTVVFLNKKSA